MDLVDFGEIVRRWRRNNGMSQRRLAIKAGLNQSSISRLEHGHLPGLQLYRAVTLLRIIGLMPQRPRVASTPRAGTPGYSATRILSS